MVFGNVLVLYLISVRWPPAGGGRAAAACIRRDYTEGETGMLAFFLGIILGALGGLMFLVLLAELVRKDELLESSELKD